MCDYYNISRYDERIDPWKWDENEWKDIWDVELRIGVSWMLDRYQFVYNDEWVYVPHLAIQPVGEVSEEAQGDLSSEEFVVSAATLWVDLELAERFPGSFGDRIGIGSRGIGENPRKRAYRDI